MAGDNAAKTPRRFGDYTLERLLGRGGMGHVWLARAHGLGDRVCVVKTLLVNDEVEYQQRFVDEARLLVMLSHRNICAVFDAGCVDGRYYLAMEHIDGRDLKEIMLHAEERAEAVPAPLALYVVKEVLAALASAHRTTHPLTGEALRVVHRDVSPQNVMLALDGRVKLIDFGLALSTQKVEKTAPQIVMGKLAYMAPEHARGDPLDGRADQFAVGQMLYELLANERYYAGLNTDALWRMSGVGGFRPAQLHQLPAGLRAIIERATAPERAERFPDCDAMRDAIVAFERAQGPAAAVDAPSMLRARLARVAADAAAGPPPAPPPALPAWATTSRDDDGEAAAAAPIDRSRSFRVRAVDNAVVVEGLAARHEATQVVRPTPGRSPHGDGGAAAPVPDGEHAPGPARRARIAAWGVGGAVVAAALVVGLLAGRPAAAPADAGPGDAGASVVAVPGDAGAAIAAGPVDAGAAVVAVPVDAGAAIGAGAGDAGAIVDAGAATEAAPPRAAPAGRRLPPLPADSLLRQMKQLKALCADVPCTAGVAALLQPGGPAPAEIGQKLRACYARCQRTPR